MKSQGLNQFFRIVWNAATGTWQAVAESAKGRGKTKSSRSSRPAAALLTAGSFVLLSAQALAADLPTGGNVVAGAGSISQSGSSMTVNQTTGKMAVDWQSFSIGQGNTVTFNQPSASAVALNRVLGSDVSVIQGALKANGQVFLVNPNGVLFTPTAQVTVGSLVASTLALNTADFMAGNYTFDSGSRSTDEGSALINQGNITAAGDGVGAGTIALIAAKITNTGTLSAHKGNVLLGAGSKVTLDMGGPVKLEVTQGALETLIANGGAIRANGGTVLLTSKAAGELASSVINNTGLIEAQSLATGEKGEIILFAHGGKTNVEGTLDATGGFIETSGQALNIPSTTAITAAHWLIDPSDIVIESAGGAVTGSSVSANAIETYLSGTGSLTLAADNDVTVNQAINWSANTLTLSAGGTNATGSVYINANMTATGSAGLAFNYGASGNVYVGMNGSGFKGKVDLSGTSATTVAINSVAHTIIKDRAALAGVTGAGNYVLGTTIDLSIGGDWVPITGFQGVFDGLGNTVSNLTINGGGANYLGLFDTSAGATKYRNIGVASVNITNGGQRVGALIGGLDYGSSVTNSYSTGIVQGQGQIGGLVGNMFGGNSVTNSFSTASATGGAVVGGLVGVNNGTISNSYATGAVTSLQTYADSTTGGFAGSNNQGTINNSYSTGLVTQDSTSTGAGGFVGNNLSGTINNSFWDKTTSQKTIAVGTYPSQPTRGGTQNNLSGKTTTEMKTLATYPGGWNLTGSDGAYPTLTGKPSSAWYMDGATMVSYTLAALTGTYTYTGNAYSLSSLWSSPTDIFGSTYSSWALGTDYTFQYSGSTVTSFTNAGAYTGISVNILKSGFATASSGNTSGALTIAQAPLSVTANNTSATYNASAYAGTPGVTYSGFVNSETNAVLGGTLAYGYSTVSPTNAGSYTITPSGYTSGNYALTYNTGTLTIDPKALTITGLAAQNKAYDGLTAVTLSGTAAISGVEAGDTSNVTLSGTAGGQVANANAGTAKAVSVSGLSLLGSAAGNYSVGAPAGLTVDIGQAALTVTANAASKTYDGAAFSGGNGVAYSGFVHSETASDLGGTLGYIGTSQGATNAGSYAITPGGLTSSNYSVSYVDGVLTINKAHLAVTADNQSRAYGAANPSFTQTITGYVNSETSSVLSGSATGSSAAIATTGVSTATITGSTGTLSASNYDFTAANGTLTIDPAALTVTANAHSKTYDGAAYSGGNGVAYSGFVNSETASVLGGTLGYSGTSQGATNAGSYAITPGGLTSSNYAVSFVNGSLAISQRAITVTADAKSKVSGNTDPTLTYQVTTGSLVGSDSLSGSLTRAAGETAGTYAIGQGTVTDTSNPNYQIAYTGADLTVSAAAPAVFQSAITIASQAASQSGGSSAGSGIGSGGPFSSETLQTNLGAAELGVVAPVGNSNTSGSSGSSGSTGGSGGQSISGGLALVDVGNAPPSGQGTGGSNSNTGGFMTVFVVSGGINTRDDDTQPTITR